MTVGISYGNAGGAYQVGGAAHINSFEQEYFEYDNNAAANSDKIAGYLNTVRITTFGGLAVFYANTNAFIDRSWGVGISSVGTGNFAGYISQTIVFNRKMTTVERNNIYRLMQELLGKGWT